MPRRFGSWGACPEFLGFLGVALLWALSFCPAAWGRLVVCVAVLVIEVLRWGLVGVVACSVVGGAVVAGLSRLRLRIP